MVAMLHLTATGKTKPSAVAVFSEWRGKARYLCGMMLWFVALAPLIFFVFFRTRPARAGPRRD